ncbi:biotin transporter BioY [bacterium]|nr:biotin transporter BioY [bacterium]
MSKVIAHKQSLFSSLMNRFAIANTQQRILFTLLSMGIGVVLLAATAQLKFVLPFTPVPVTGQTFGVLLIAMLMGSQAGSLTVGAYLIAGAAGAPFFANVSGPHTTGYLFGMLVAARVVGYLADIGWAKSFSKAFAIGTLGTAIIFAFGLAILGKFTGYSNVLALGLYPFLIGAVIKIALASGVVSMLNRNQD